MIRPPAASCAGFSQPNRSLRGPDFTKDVHSKLKIPGITAIKERDVGIPGLASMGNLDLREAFRALLGGLMALDLGSFAKLTC